jgi:predicted component of type VI protein secretion system
MFTKQNIRIDTTQPALVVQSGNTPKKHFYLTGRSMILGCGRGCDIELAADDVSAVHCVITRSSDGLHIRDCSSLLGTKVNGVKVSEVQLNNGDLLHVGSCAFEVSVPPAPNVEDTPVDRSSVYQKRIEELEKSQERLMLLAWHLRRRFLERRSAETRLPAQPDVNPDRPPTLPELNLDELEARALLPSASEPVSREDGSNNV